MNIKFIKQISKFFIVSLLFSFLQSCENLIEVDLPDNQINTEDVFKEIHTTQAALASLYINVRESSLFNGGYSGIGSVLDTYCDNLDDFSGAGANTGINEFFNNTIIPNNYTLNILWKNNYEHIYALNAFIEGLSSSTYITEEDKTVFLGEAYFLRALYYHYLTQLFGDIPYTTTTDYRFNTTISKTKTEDVLNYVEQDLKTAWETLPLEYRNPERIYPNKAAAELLLAKNYLLQKQYAQAAIFAQNVLKKYDYVLEKDINKVFKKTAQSTIWQLGNEANGVATLEAGNYIFDSTPPTRFALSSELIHSFDEEDKRLLSWTNEVSQNGQSWYHAYKYKNNNSNEDEYSILFRIEEAYFVLIEALAYQNQTAEAVNYLNLIRHRAGFLPLPETLSKEEFINEMLNESRKEFFTEGGHRFFDLKRNNALNTLKIVKPNWEDKHTLLPIPEKEIILNPNLLPQNEGY